MRAPDGVARPLEVAAMFARIVPRYDLMNRLMTFGMDAAWRRSAVNIATDSSSHRALDVGTGTAALALALAQRVPRVVGIDFCEPMLHTGRQKVQEAGRFRSVCLLPADGLRLPFADNSFDCATSAFTVRNIPDVVGVFREMARVVRPGGRIVCLELSPIENPWLARLFRPYFHRVVPLVGTLMSGDGDAYRYLPLSVDRFPSADALARLMEEAGLRDVDYRRLTFGTVALHYGTK